MAGLVLLVGILVGHGDGSSGRQRPFGSECGRRQQRASARSAGRRLERMEQQDVEQSEGRGVVMAAVMHLVVHGCGDNKASCYVVVCSAYVLGVVRVSK